MFDPIITFDFPWIVTTVSSASEIGMKYGYSPAAWASLARVNPRHLSNSAMFWAAWVVDTVSSF